MSEPDGAVHLVAQIDSRSVNNDRRHDPTTEVRDTIQVYSSHLSGDQLHCTTRRPTLWSRFLAGIAFMRAAVASYVAFPTVQTTNHPGGHEEDPRFADQQQFENHARRGVRADIDIRQLDERILQVRIASRLQDEERVTAFPFRLASTMSKPENVSNQTCRSCHVDRPSWHNDDHDAGCVSRTTQGPSSPSEKLNSNIRSISPSAVGQIDFTEYEQDILRYQKQLEAKLIPDAQYMKYQSELNWTMRAMLVDWIIQVHQRFELRPETLFLGVNYIDRFLSCRVVSADRFQLLGAAAVLIAVKYEEGEPIPVATIDLITSKRYGIEMVQKAERMILAVLQFELGWPGPMTFLRRTLVDEGDDDRIAALAQYFLEVSLMDERFISDLPSCTAAVSHLLARMMLASGAWVGTQTTCILVLH